MPATVQESSTNVGSLNDLMDLKNSQVKALKKQN